MHECGKAWLLFAKASAAAALSLPTHLDRPTPFTATESKQILLSKMQVAAGLVRGSVWAGPVLAVIVAAGVFFAVWALLVMDNRKEQDEVVCSSSTEGVAAHNEQSHFWPALAVLAQRVMGIYRLILALTCICTATGAAGSVCLLFVLPGGFPSSSPGMASYEAGLHFDSKFPGRAQGADFVCLLQVDPPGQVLELPGLRDLVFGFRAELNATGRLVDFHSQATTPASDTATADAFDVSDFFVSQDGSSTLMEFSIKDNFQSQEAALFASWSRDVFNRLASEVPGLSYHGILSVPDMVDAGIRDLQRLLFGIHLIAVPLIGGVFWCVLGSARLMVVPAVTVAASAIMSLGLLFCWHWVQTLDCITPSLMMAIVIAMGTDYSLFILTRFRQELAALHAEASGADPGPEALVRAAIPPTMAMSGFTVLSSGLLLIFCLLTLVCIPVPIISGLGVGATIALIVTVLVNIVVVPALLVAFPRFFVKCVPECASTGTARDGRSTLACREASYPVAWKLVARWTTSWPGNIIVVCVTVCIAVALSPALTQMQTTNDLKGFMPRGTEAFQAYGRLESTFGRSHVAPFKVMLEPPLGSTVTTQEFWRDSQRILNALGATLPSTNKWDILFPSFAKGLPVPWVVHSLCDGQVSSRLCTMYSFLLDRFTNEQKDAAWGVITPSCDPFDSVGMAWVEQFRRSADVLSQETGIRVTLVGPGVDSADVVGKVYQAFPIMIAVDLVAVLLLCGVVFRSVLIPLWQSASIALTLVTSYGVAVHVYQHGALNWLGLRSVSGTLIGVPWAAPVIAFPFLVGLCLDYDVFLLTQVTHFRTLGYDAQDAIRHGLCSSGGIISAAGIIMSISFMSLLASSIMMLDCVALVVVVTVLYDAFVIRTMVVPALMSFAGRYQWWPSPLSKLKTSRSPDAVAKL